MIQVRSANAEAEMIVFILAGDTHLFHELIRPYERTVFAMAAAMMRNEQEAEDVAQETFLRALRNLRSYRAEARFSTWLISIALNEARAKLRRANTVAFETLGEAGEGGERAAPELFRDWREIPLEVLERMEVRRLIQEAVTELPVIYREVFLLRDVEELSVSEAAEALGISVTSVKVRLHRARIKLQKRLAPELRRMTPARRRFPW
jgi:RNA polymerase sigma-70 factor (ECF subfamily)